MKSGHGPQQANDGVQPGGWVESEGNPSEMRVLDGYLREMGGATRLRPEEERRLAEELRNSRCDLQGSFSGLPEPWRTQVLDGGGASELPLLNASRDEVEAAYRRLLLLTQENPSAELEEAVAEARRCRARHERARDAMIVANLRLVVRVVGKFKNRGIPLLDLIQEGNLGLIRAVEKFEVERGYRFSTYAIWWIRHGLSKAFSESSRLIRLPANVGMAVRRLRQRRRHLERVLGRTPTTDEIATDAGLPRSRIVELLAASRTPLSLDEPGENDEPSVHSKRLADNDRPDPLEHLADRERHDALLKLLGRLSERERKIVKLRLGIECDAPHTLARIAEMLQVSRERIRQIEHRALIKLRNAHASINRPPVSPAMH